jgi:hypothetical protein
VSATLLSLPTPTHDRASAVKPEIDSFDSLDPADLTEAREKWRYPLMYPENTTSLFFEVREWLLDRIDTHLHIAWLMPKLWRRTVREMARTIR